MIIMIRFEDALKKLGLRYYISELLWNSGLKTARDFKDSI